MVSHTVLLVIGGALLTGLLGAFVFGSTGTAEDKRLREQQKLLRALEAQRRIRDVQLMREARRRGAPIYAPPPPAMKVEPEPMAAEPMPDEVQEAELRAAERQRKRDEKEQAAALKSAREAEKRAQRRAEQERKSAAKAQRATLRAAEQQQKREEKEKATALKAERDAQEQAVNAPEPAAPSEPEPREQPAAPETDKPLSELPLYSWAIEAEDRNDAS